MGLVNDSANTEAGQAGLLDELIHYDRVDNEGGAAAGLVGMWQHEGWTERAVIPVKGDVPTVGPGLTRREDGTPVQMGDRTTPVEGLKRSAAYLARAEGRVKACVKADLYPVEFDTMMNFGYQYGQTTLCKSDIVKKANAGDYVGSCKAYLNYRFVKGYDCSTLVNGERNKVCWGVWTRSKERYDKCMGAQ